MKAGVQEKQLIAERVFILILRTVFKVKAIHVFSKKGVNKSLM